MVEHIYSKLKPRLQVYDENGHLSNLERHIDKFFHDNLDGRICEPGCGHEGANQYSSIKKHSQVVVRPMIVTQLVTVFHTGATHPSAEVQLPNPKED